MKIVSRVVSALALGVMFVGAATTVGNAAELHSAHSTPTSAVSVDRDGIHGRPANLIRPVALSLSPEQLEQWQRLTGTVAGREQVVADLQEAFAGVATIGTTQTVVPATGGGMRPDLATGITGDHFWIIASYADIVDGAVWVGVQACETKLPSWLCTTAGNLLTSWASGWGSGNDHGVWAAIYWLPPHVTGGRW